MTAWLQIAWDEINAGVAEVPGAAANPRIIEYFRASGHPEVTSDEVAWCAAAVGYCLHEAGVDLSALPKGLELRAMSYRKIGTHIDEPRVGAIAVLARHVAGDPGAAHVGIVAGITPTHITLAGGNQSDSFNVTPFPRSQVIEYRWPVVVARGDVVATSRIAQAGVKVGADGKKAGFTELARNTLPTEMPGLDHITGWMGKTQGATETLIQFAGFAWGKLPIVLGLITLYWLARMAWTGLQITRWRHEDAATGKTLATEEVPDVAPG